MLLLPSIVSQAQNYLSVAPSYGTQLITEDNDSLLHDYITGVDVSYGQSTDSMTGDWVKFLNAKYIEYSFIYLDLNQLRGFYDPNPYNYVSNHVNGLGRHYGVISSIAIKLFQINKQFHAYFLPGFGLSYVTKTYFTDNQDRYIGSHLNYTIRFELAFEQQIQKNLTLTSGFRGIHFSNGGYQVPNAGINAIGAKLGLTWKFNASK